MFWYYVLRVDVFITVVTFQNVDYTCTQTVVLNIMVLLELTSIHIIEYRSIGIWAVNCYVAIRLGSDCELATT